MAYEIEKGVPLIKAPRVNQIYPLDHMDVGDSFVAPASKRNSISSVASLVKKKTGASFAIRNVESECAAFGARLKDSPMPALNIKPGDMVRLKPIEAMRVDSEGRPTVCFADTFVWLAFDEIEEVVPRPLGPGDRVKALGGADGRIVAIDGDFAWVRFQEAPDRFYDSPNTIKLSSLTRID